MRKKLLRNEKGAIDISSVLLMGIGMVFLAVGFIVYPIVTTATDGLLAYTYSPYASIAAATFTGFVQVVGITPLLVLVGYLAAGVFTMFLGVQVVRGVGSAKVDLGSLIMLALSIVFIAIALIMMPVALDGVSSVLAHKADTSDSGAVTTAVSVTTGNITLTKVLYNNSVSEVISVSSNITETALAADNYTGGKLFLTGLTDNATRTITANYHYADLLAGYTGTYQVLLLTPLLVLISFLAGAVITGFFGIRAIARG